MLLQTSLVHTRHVIAQLIGRVIQFLLFKNNQNVHSTFQVCQLYSLQIHLNIISYCQNTLLTCLLHAESSGCKSIVNLPPTYKCYEGKSRWIKIRRTACLFSHLNKLSCKQSIQYILKHFITLQMYISQLSIQIPT